MTVEATPYARLLWQALNHEPDKTFWIGRSDRKTYADLRTDICSIVHELNQCELSSGDTVLIATPDDWTAFSAWVACLMNGQVPVMLAPDVGLDRVRSIADRAAPALCVTSEARKVEDWAKGRTICDDLLHGDTKSAEPSFAASGTDLAYLLFTSGSTSTPKGVMISHDALAAQMRTIARVLRVDRNARVFNGLVLHHADGLLQGPLLALTQSATVLRPDAFRLSRLAEDMAWQADMQATHLVGSPTLLHMIDQSCSDDTIFARPDFVAILSSSAPLRPGLWDRIEGRFAVPVINEYGMTETVAASHFAGSFPDMGARRTIGRPVDMEARLVDADGTPVAKGEVGEIQVKGPAVFSGYLGDLERTDAAFSQGWLKTSDLARITVDGDYHLLGRADDVINAGGFSIYPGEIEDVLFQHESVDDIKVIGVDDLVFSEVPVCLYTAKSPVSEADVLAFCRDRLEARKCPKRAFQVQSIPRNASSKPDIVSIRALIERLMQDVTPAVRQGRVEDRLLALAEAVFGAGAGSLTLDDTPETVPGWDSFAHTALALEVEDQFDVRIPTARLFAISSLGQLNEIVQGAGKSIPDQFPPGVKLLRHGSGSAGSIVVMPNLTGGVQYIARMMDTLDDQQDILGLPRPPGSVDMNCPTTIQEISNGLADLIVKAELQPPLILVGMSFGGFLAYETAAELMRRKHKVRAVILLDTAVPWRHRRGKALHHVAEASRTGFRGVERLLGKSGPSPDLVRIPGMGVTDISQHRPELRALIRHSVDALRTYSPSAAWVPMLIFAAKNRQQGRIPLNSDLGWSEFTEAPITSHWLGSDHVSLVRQDGPAVQAAEKINAYLAEPASLYAR